MMYGWKTLDCHIWLNFMCQKLWNVFHIQWYHPRVLLPWIWHRRILPFLILFIFVVIYQLGPMAKKLQKTAHNTAVYMYGQNPQDSFANEDGKISLKDLQEQDQKAQTLQEELVQLQLTLQDLKTQKDSMEKKLKTLMNDTQPSLIADRHLKMILQGFFLSQEKKAEVTKGNSYFYEYEVPIFRFFNTTLFYDTDNIVTAYMSRGQKQTQDLLNFSLKAFKTKGREDRLQYSENKLIFSDEIGGLYRTEPGIGTQYHLHFHNTSGQRTGNDNFNISQFTKEELNQTVTRVVLFRPFGPLVLMETSYHNYSEGPIHLVITLSGRLNLYKQFISVFKSEVIMKKHNVYLTVVYFGSEGLTEASTLTNSLKSLHYKKGRLITVPDRNFTRSLGIEMAVKSWNHQEHEDVLTMISDVDIAFRGNFLHNCQRYTVAGKQVYYPIVFNQYNGSTVPDKPDYYNSLPLDGYHAINTKSKFGRWKSESYGVLCTYLSDFLKMNMFDGKRFSKWGREDLHLYRKYVKSTLKVIRVQDPEIFHRSHWKECPSDLSDHLYYECMKAKGQDYSAHAELGNAL